MYELNCIRKYDSQPNKRKSNNIPADLISEPESPKYKIISLLIIPISYKRLIQILLKLNTLNNSINLRTKLINQ